jgi:hypothetical protein
MSGPLGRRRILFGALAVTLVLTAASGKEWQGDGEPVTAPAAPVARPASAKAPAPLPRVELERLSREDASQQAPSQPAQAFRAMSWYVPPPPPPPKPPPKPVPPPPPTAPPLPFSFMGRYEEGDTLIILLVRGERIYTVSEGEVIDNTYRVERLAGGQLELTYLPLNIKQTLNAGGT